MERPHRSDGAVSVAQFSGIANALGVAALDMTALTNGVHTILWVMTDSVGGAVGVGSRYFTVSNGAGLALAPDFRLKAEATGSSLSPSWLPSSGGRDDESLVCRRGYDLGAPYQTYHAGADGRITIHSEEIDRVELQLDGGGASEAAFSAYLRVGGALAPLPIGLALNASTGEFTWQPGVAFVGPYDFVFVRWADRSRASRPQDGASR